MLSPDISTFCLDILRRDKRQTFSRDFTEGDAFQQLCYDLLTPEFKNKGIRLTLYCTFPTEHERENFKNKIKDMLQSLFHIDGLKHLQQVAEKVELYSWDDLKPILENTPFLYHKWIEANFIEGVENVSKPINPKEPRYKDYLYTEKLNILAVMNTGGKTPMPLI